MKNKEKEEKICEMYIAGETIKNICNTVGTCSTSIMKVVRNNNIPERKKGKIEAKKIEVIDGRGTERPDISPRKELPQTPAKEYLEGLKNKKEKLDHVSTFTTFTFNERKTCECGCKTNPQNARFCCSCGRRLRTETEIVQNKVFDLTSYFGDVPVGTRDKFRNNVLSIIQDIGKLMEEKGGEDNV